jgi:hypothetical protein
VAGKNRGKIGRLEGEKVGRWEGEKVGRWEVKVERKDIHLLTR